MNYKRFGAYSVLSLSLSLVGIATGVVIFACSQGEDQTQTAQLLYRAIQTPCGEMIIETGSREDIDYTFTGYEQDGTLPLLDAGARFYSSALCQFVSVDPVDGPASSYRYAGNNFLTRVDPDGRQDGPILDSLAKPFVTFGKSLGRFWDGLFRVGQTTLSTLESSAGGIERLVVEPNVRGAKAFWKAMEGQELTREEYHDALMFEATLILGVVGATESAGLRVTSSNLVRSGSGVATTRASTLSSLRKLGISVAERASGDLSFETTNGSLFGVRGNGFFRASVRTSGDIVEVTFFETHQYQRQIVTGATLRRMLPNLVQMARNLGGRTLTVTADNVRNPHLETFLRGQSFTQINDSDSAWPTLFRAFNLQ